MFLAGILGSVIASIIEVLIYALLPKHIKRFFIASLIMKAIGKQYYRNIDAPLGA